MENAKHIGGMWALAVALGVGMAVAASPAVALAAPGDSQKGSSSAESSSGKPAEKPSAKKHESSTTNDGPKRHRPKSSDAASSSLDTPSTTKKPRAEEKPRNEERTRGGTTTHPVSSSAPVKTNPTPAVINAASSPFASAPTDPVPSSAVDPGFISSTHNFGLFSVTSAADPDDNNYVAFVFSTLLFTNVLTSGTDPEDNLGFGAASIGVAGHTVNTFISPFFTFSVGIPITDPFAVLFTELVRQGF